MDVPGRVLENTAACIRIGFKVSPCAGGNLEPVADARGRTELALRGEREESGGAGGGGEYMAVPLCR
jgi:hypothetical protein